MSQTHPVVGIGASAGGLEALQDFVRAIPPDSGIAYVVVQHLAPDHPSIMDKLLREHARVEVRKIEDGAEIAPDCVHVVPAGPFLEIRDGRFHLLEHAREEGVRTPIDRFFTSLAEAGGREAFGVVLSGTGSDGTVGVRAIKAKGGIALVQESRSARFPGMPDSAAATGMVDFVLRPGDMPRRIVDIAQHRRELDESGRRPELSAEVERRLSEVLAILTEDEGLPSFADYKPGTLVRRIMRRMTLLRLHALDDYLAMLRESEDERRLLTQDFLIGVTEFFRGDESYEALRDLAIRPLLERDRNALRIWVPGCSTGEEAYSIAILVAEVMQELGRRRPVQVFGTDVDLEALRHARVGRYAEAAIKNVSGARRTRFFLRENGHWQVSSQLREMCVFAPHDLLQDPPFSRLDLISCRNVMIYLSADAQENVIPRFHYGLNPGGYLWLGPSETLGRSVRYFDTIDRNARIFRRNDRSPKGFSALRARPAGPARRPSGAWPGPGLGDSDAHPERSAEQEAEQLFLRRFASPFAVIDRRGEVIHVSEAMADYVRPTRGRPQTNIDDFLTPELRLPVHSAVSECREAGAGEVRNVVATVQGRPRLLDVLAAPANGEREEVMVVLREVRQQNLSEVAEEVPGGRRTEALERDLMLTRKRLNTLQQEYEAAEQELRSSNEELLSMNEELQSSNEELETSREELQSINEELETINAELTENNRQLGRANSDLKNLLESTDVATLFLDDNGCVRLFTPELARIFSVQERDVGRPISDLATQLDYPRLADDAEQVRRTLQPVEREVRAPATDETFQARLRPYRTVDNRLDGCVITFVDVTARKRHEHQLEENARVLSEQYAELETLYDTAPVGLNLLDRDLRYLRINEEMAAINGYPAEAHVGRLQKDLIPKVHAEVEPIQRRVLDTGEPVRGLTVQGETPAQPGRIREWIVDYYPVVSHGEVVAVGSCVREVTKERQLERRVAESEARLARLFDHAPAFIAMHEGPEHVYIYSNPLHDRIVGRRPLIGRPLREAAPELADSGVFERFDEVYRTGEPSEIRELRATVRNDGGPRTGWFTQVLQPWFDDEGRVGGVMSFAFEITEQVEARERVRESRERLQKLQDSLPAFVGLLDADGTLREANATALERGGVARAEVIGRKFWDCWWWSYSPEAQERLRDAVARAAQGALVRYDVQARMAGGEMIWIDFQLAPLRDETGRVAEIIPSAIDVTERLEAEERKNVLLAELQHRVKNILAIVQSIMRFTARTARDQDALVASMQDRLAALARTHDALTQDGWRGRGLRAVFEAEVAPFVDPQGDRFSFEGPDLHLDPSTAISLGLGIHELATNAAKHGAFATREGRVAVTAEACDGRLSRLEWRESGGRPASPPQHQGFGTFLLNRVLGAELGADVIVEYPEEGLRCRIETRREAR